MCGVYELHRFKKYGVQVRLKKVGYWGTKFVCTFYVNLFAQFMKGRGTGTLDVCVCEIEFTVIPGNSFNENMKNSDNSVEIGNNDIMQDITAPQPENSNNDTTPLPPAPPPPPETTVIGSTEGYREQSTIYVD